MLSRVSQVIETLFRIYDKNGKLVDFKLNRIQRRFDTEIIKPIEDARLRGATETELYELVRQSVLKYRQGGISTLVLAWFLTECMNDYACCVMLTHDKDHSEKLLYRARIMLKNMKGPKPRTSKLNDNEIAFEKTDSLFYIGTAGSKEFGRSATITHLHCSEIAFWKDPAKLMKSLFQAVPRGGVIIHETTANGWGNWFQKSFYNYLAGLGGFIPRFYSWYIHDEYTSGTPYQRKEGAYNLEDWARELKMYKCIRQALPHLTAFDVRQKLQWRREKLAENLGDQGFDNALRDFQQEYPHTYEEAFVMSGGMLFRDLTQIKTSDWKQIAPGEFQLEGHPKAGSTYALGADFAGGTGNDNSTIVIQCIESREQVYRYANNMINPIDFAPKMARVGREFHDAYVVPEYNHHGIAGCAILKKIYPRFRIYKHVLPKAQWVSAQHNIPSYGYGWKTSAMTKPYMVGVGIQFIRAGYIIYDPLTYDELKSFAEDPDTHKMEGTGDHDDCAVAWLLSCIGVLKQLKVRGLNPDELDEHLIRSATEVLIEQQEKAKKVVTLHTHRNDDGQYLIQFDELFVKQGRKHHA